MSKKYRNPVAKHFVYNEETRKSMCKKCFFDMAGRHSENLMRHLKRKHVDTYDEVLTEKLRIRQLLCQEELFHPKTHLVVKDSTQLQNSISLIDSEDNASGSKFDGIFIGKTEIPDLNPADDESGPEDKDCDDRVAEALSTTSSVTNVAPPPPPPPALLLDTCPGLPSEDDASFFLQYLGSKLSKYSSHTKNTVQYQINKILYKADMGCFEQTDPNQDDSDF